MLKLIKKTGKKSITFLRRHKAKSLLSQLTSHDSFTIRSIGDALYESLNNLISTEEKKIIDEIEKRRNILLNSKEKITLIDYGAGNPNVIRAKDEMEKGVVSTLSIAKICHASKSPFHATFLFKLVRKLKPLYCVELGTCVGISGAYQAAALKFNGKGKLITLEGSPELANYAKQTFENLNFNEVSIVVGPFQKMLTNVLMSTGDNSVDFFFNDGHHDHDAVIKYFNEVYPFLSDKAVIVFDDISWSPGMRNAWLEIENDKRVTTSVDFHDIGIAVVQKNKGKNGNFRIPL